MPCGAVDHTLHQALDALCSQTSPYGQEGPLARHLHDLATAAWPHVQWEVIDTPDLWSGRDSAALLGTSSVARTDGGLLLYSHLDTSLSANARLDQAITGDAPAAAPTGWNVCADGSTISGFGLGVAKAPAAAALAGFVLASSHLHDTGTPHRLQLLLSSRGTHRCVTDEHGHFHRPLTGVAAYLARTARPAAVVVCKSGPPALVLEEPGAFMFHVRVQTDWGLAMLREAATPPGGLIAHAGVLIHALDTWAQAFSRRPAPPGSRCGHACALGGLQAGEAGKPDLLPGRLVVSGYGVMPGRIDAEALQADLQEGLAQSLRGGPLSDNRIRVDVRVHALHDGHGTSMDSEVARLAGAAWQRETGQVPEQPAHWTGNTDAVVFRAAGLPTVRLGPQASKAPTGSIDHIDRTSLLRCVRMYRFLGEHLPGQASPTSLRVPT